MLNTHPQSETGLELFDKTLGHHVLISAIRTRGRYYSTSPKDLATKWGIRVDGAQWTLEVTTQCGVQTVLHPTLSCHFQTNDRQLQYRRLSHDMYTDMLESHVVSWFCRNRYAQVFATHFGWV